MHTREASRWLRRRASAREAMRADGQTFFIPLLGSRDVAVAGEPMDFATADEAIACANRFQADVRRNHPEAAE